MRVAKYKVCGDLGCDTLTTLAVDIQDALELKNVRIDPKTGEIRYENPKNCHVDEHKLEDAARKSGKDIRFGVCE